MASYCSCARGPYGDPNWEIEPTGVLLDLRLLPDASGLDVLVRSAPRRDRRGVSTLCPSSGVRQIDGGHA